MNQYDKKSIKRYCRSTIMAMNAQRPMDAAERRRDLAFAITLCVLALLVPIFAGAALVAKNKTLAAVIVSDCAIVLALAIGLVNRRRVLRRFYSVPDAHDLVDVRDGAGELDRLAEISPTLLYPAPPLPELLDLFYNWLCNRAIITPGERIEAYRVTAEELEGRLNAPVDPGFEGLLFPLVGHAPDDWRRFGLEGQILNLRLLGDLIKKEDEDKS